MSTEAVGHFLAGRYAEAHPLLRERAEQQEGGLQTLLYLSECCARLGLTEEAADWGDQATQASPHSPRAWTCCGHALASQREWAAAAECYGRACELDRRASASRLHLGQTLIELGELEQARTTLEAGLQLEPGNPELQEALGRALARGRRWEQSLAAYRQAHLAAPAWGQPLFGMGSCLQELGRFEEAALCLQQALRRDPHRAELWGCLGSILLSSLEAGTLTREVLHEAARLQPDNPSYWSWLGASYAGEGLFDEASGCFQQAVALEPALARHRYNWGLALLGRGRLPEAALQFSRAVELDPQPVEYGQSLELAHRLAKGALT